MILTRTQPRNPSPVEPMIGVYGLFGLIGRHDPGNPFITDSYLAMPADPARPSQPDARCAWLAAAGTFFGPFGLSAECPGHIKLS